MPCDSVYSIEIDAGKMSPSILAAGLRADGHAVTLDGQVVRWNNNSYDATTGKLITSDRNAAQFTAGVKQSYSREVIRSQAKRAGWTVKQEGNKFQITKR